MDFAATVWPRYVSNHTIKCALNAFRGMLTSCGPKWMVLEARKLSKHLLEDENLAAILVGSFEYVQSTVNALDSMGYDEAAKEVYGETYSEWKKRHQKKASDEQM